MSDENLTVEEKTELQELGIIPKNGVHKQEETTEEEPKKKRGRPKKEQASAQAEEPVFEEPSVENIFGDLDLKSALIMVASAVNTGVKSGIMFGANHLSQGVVKIDEKYKEPNQQLDYALAYVMHHYLQGFEMRPEYIYLGLLAASALPHMKVDKDALAKKRARKAVHPEEAAESQEPQG